MADDAVFMVAGQGPFGKQAFARAVDAQQKFRMESASDIGEIEVSGDPAYMRSYLHGDDDSTWRRQADAARGLEAHDPAKHADSKWMLARLRI